MALQQLIYIVKPARVGFANSSTDEEKRTIGEHFNYLKNLLEEKILIIAGPETNSKFGIIVFEAESEEKAREIMNNDPAVAGKVFTAELFPFRVSLLRS